LARRLSFSSGRLSEFWRLVSWLVSQRGLTAATKLEDWVNYAIRSDCAPYSLAQFDNLAQKTRLSRLVQGAGHCQLYVNPRITLVLGLVPHILHAHLRGGGEAGVVHVVGQISLQITEDLEDQPLAA